MNKKVIKFMVEDDYMSFLNDAVKWVFDEIKMLVWAHDIKPGSSLEEICWECVEKNIDMYCDSITKAIGWGVLNRK